MKEELKFGKCPSECGKSKWNESLLLLREWKHVRWRRKKEERSLTFSMFI